MSSLVQDLRYALRQMRKAPIFAVTAVLTLALGIGANTAIFSVMNAVLLKGLPVPDPQEIFYVHMPSGRVPGMSNTGDYQTSFSVSVFEHLREERKVLADLIAFAPLAISGKTSVRFGDTPEQARGDMVSGNFFSGLRVQPARGRGFTLEDERTHAPVAVLSWDYWTRRLSRNPSVLGQAFDVKGVPFTVIGIAPERFLGVEPGFSTDFWIPLQDDPALNAWGIPPEFTKLYATANWWCLELVARLQPGLSAERAAAALNPVFQEAALVGAGQPDPNAPKPVLMFKPARGIEGLDTEGTYRSGVFVLMGLVGLVLVIACVNVAMLLVARQSERQREFGLRRALGASALRTFRQLFLESALLVVSGAVLGWMFALASTRVLATWADIESGLSPDREVMLFTLLLSGLAAFVFGMAPLRQATRAPAGMALTTRTGHRTRLARLSGNAVMAAQMTLCFVLLVTAGLLLRTLRNYQTTDLGLNTHGLLVFGLTPQKSSGDPEPFYRNLMDRLRSLPGVDSAALMVNRLGTGWSDNNSAVVDGVERPYRDAPLRSNTVGPDTFHALGVPLLDGREFTDADTATSSRTVVVNETFVKKYLPGTPPLGHQLGLRPPRTIVGVVKDSKYTSVDEQAIPMSYVPCTQVPGIGHMEIVVRTSGDPLAMLPTIERAVRGLDPALPLEEPNTQQAIFDHSFQNQKMFSRLSTFFGLLAAFLVAIGLYGTLAYRVSRRTSEIGVRMALGALRWRVLWMILWESLVVAAWGLVLGLAVALLSADLLRSLLYGLEPRDPMTLAGALGMVLLVTLAASFFPARRAAGIEPFEALRSE
jgi:predicted permease